ncbi:MAG: Mo-dependent nitrogenase C-terminal domain-containing protein [Kovacikia sp.]
MNASRYETPNPNAEKFVWVAKEVKVDVMVMPDQASAEIRFAPLQPIRHWLDNIKIDNANRARFFCRLIPAQCPFERTIQLFDRPLFHIPPLCKLNPFYEQFVGLRFRALSYLVDECGEDITPYC